MYSYLWRESLELQRDPVRLTLAMLGSVILMLVMGFGISMDVEDLTYAVLDRDQTTLSENYALNIAGSRYFVQKPPLESYADMDARLRSGKLALAIEIPPGFARDVARGRKSRSARGSTAPCRRGPKPFRAMSRVCTKPGWRIRRYGVTVCGPRQVAIETRFRYNPDVKSLPAMVPADSAATDDDAGDADRPVGCARKGTRLHPESVRHSRHAYRVLAGQADAVCRPWDAELLPDVVPGGHPVWGTGEGNFLALVLAALIFNVVSTGVGLFASTFTRSQIAALFFTMIGTMIPTIQFSGLLTPVSSMEGAGKVIGGIYPATHMLIISRGVFNKALGLIFTLRTGRC
jgi:ribosome-dependent ATPase